MVVDICEMDPCFGGTTHISCLFPEVLTMIFSYLDVKDKGRVSQVCTTWRDAAYNRRVWRGVVAKLHLKRANPSLFPSLVRRGIKRVQILSLRRSLKDVVMGIENLENMDLSGCYNVNDLGLSHAFTQNTPSITVLNLSLCKQITDGSIGKIATYLTNLEVLNLAGCSNITSNGLHVIAWKLHRLKSLNLRSCRHILDYGVGYLCGQCDPQQAKGTLQLEELVLQDCQKLTDQCLKNISCGLHKLKSLNLSFCASITDSGLKFLAKMPTLESLNLASCDNVSDIGVGFLAEGGSRIKCLDVSFCERIGDQALVHISVGLFNLTSLSLCACSISDDGIGKLVRTAHELTTLNIGQCARITDESLISIADHLKKLKSIDLYGCTLITTTGLQRITLIKGLTTLNLGLWHKK